MHTCIRTYIYTCMHMYVCTYNMSILRTYYSIIGDQTSFHFKGTEQFSGRVSTHGVVGHRIDSIWWTHCVISCSNQCSITGVRKIVMCTINEMEHVKDSLL